MPQNFHRFNAQKRYNAVMDLIATVKNAQNIQEAVEAYPHALEQLANYTRDTEKRDKEGDVIREAGSFKRSIDNTFKENFTQYTEKALKSLATANDYDDIYAPLQAVLNTLLDKSFLETWNRDYASTLRSIGGAQLEGLDTIAAMLNHNHYQKIASGLSVLPDPTPLQEWKVQYANAVITRLSEALEKVENLEEIQPLVEQARVVMNHLPEPQSIIYKPWKKFTYLETSSASDTITILHQNHIRTYLEKRMKAASSPEELTRLVSHMKEQPYKSILGPIERVKLRETYSSELYKQGYRAMLALTDQKDPSTDRSALLSTIYTEYKQLLSDQSIYEATKGPYDPNQKSSQGNYNYYIMEYRHSLAIYKNFAAVILHMQRSHNVLELQEPAIIGRELFPAFRELVFEVEHPWSGLYNDMYHRQSKEMEVELINHYSTQLYLIATETLGTIDSLEALGAHYEQTESLLSNLNILFYPENTKQDSGLMAIHRTSARLLEKFQQACIAKEEAIIEKQALEELEPQRNNPSK
jgi:hypothetical protein